MPSSIIRTCLVAALAAWAISGLPEAPAAEAIDAKRLDELVAQLGDEDVDVRDTAQCELEGLDPCHLERLRALYVQTEDLEVRTRLRFAVAQVASKLDFEPDRLLNAARLALQEGHPEQAEAAIREMVAILRKQWERSPHVTGTRRYFYPTAGRDSLLKLCTCLSECMNDTITRVTLVLLADGLRDPDAEKAELRIYEVRDLSYYPDIGDNDPLRLLCKAFFAELTSRAKDGLLELQNGHIVAKLAPVYHALMEDIIRDFRARRTNR